MDYLCLLSKMPHRKRICRLCFKTCVDNFRAIENNAKETLDILLLKIDLSVSEEPVICTNCAENLGKLFDFKSTCLYTQGYVGPFVNSARLDLKDVYQSKGESENSIGIPKDHTIYGFCILCGFCMDLLTSCSLVSPDSKEEGVILEKMMLEKCLPELVCILILYKTLLILNEKKSRK
ncbi:hypothetical protein NQ314_004924 [Rhamnusium bicolor]|uniref:ZAD domain-containing protein n=1 Tax=Rhamnusium bicolor TaxID=1586634 RepID=A0AAV8ZL12_9CUCU|nr:hypothetical protein NQ314_004924 [Rhamnusium bicolor]